MNIRFSIDKDGQGIVDRYIGSTYKDTIYCNTYMLLENNEFSFEEVLKSFKDIHWSLNELTQLHNVLMSGTNTLLYTDSHNKIYFHTITEDDNI